MADFPIAGKTTTVSWSEPHQNFIIAKTTATEPKVGILSAITDRLNRFAVTNVGTESADILGVAATKDDAGEATQLSGLAWTDSSQSIQADVALAANALPATYRDSSGVEAQFSNFTATTTTVSFFDRSGNPQGQPVTVPINMGFLQSLQNVANRIAINAKTASLESGFKQLSTSQASSDADPRQTQAANSALWFTPNALLINAQWYGGLTTGEILCAVNTAAAKVGILSQIAAKGCQSTLIQAVLNRATATRQTQADTFTDVVDPAAQQSLQFSADVAESPCAANATSTDCLIPVATIVKAREETGTPIAPDPPPVQYTGTIEYCFTVTADFGNRGSCATKCTSGSTATTLNSNGALSVTSPRFHYNWNFDSSGNCTAADMSLRDGSFSSLGTAANGSFNYQHKLIRSDTGVTVATIQVEGSYSPSALTGSGSIRYTHTGNTGKNSLVDIFEKITLQR